MGIRTPRKKQRVPLLSLLYRMHRLLPLSKRRKLKLYLDLEWIFDRLAMEMSFEHYPSAGHPFRRKAREFLHSKVDRNMTVLDLGCKTGDVSFPLAGIVKEVVGVDHDGEAIATAQRTHQLPNLSFHHVEALAYLNASEKQFDVLLLSHILEHLDDPEAFLGMFKGHFTYIYIELPDFDKTYLNLYRADLGSTLIYTDDDHISEFDRDELKAVLTKCGIDVLESEYRFGVQRLWCRVKR